MNRAKILISIKEVTNYLKMVDIHGTSTSKINELKIGKYSDKYYQTFHEGNYRKTFIVASENRDFDIALDDGSLFQFTMGKDTEIHYSFLHRIEKILSLKEYIDENLSENNIDTIEREYETYLSTDKESVYPCPIRYDVSESEYKHIVHAFAHIHFGIDNEIRIPVGKIIKPLTFVDFVVKHIYKEKWDRAYLNDKKFRDLVDKLKSESEEVDKEFFTDAERNFLYIT